MQSIGKSIVVRKNDVKLKLLYSFFGEIFMLIVYDSGIARIGSFHGFDLNLSPLMVNFEDR